VSELGEVRVVAPLKEMSGASHAFTYNSPLSLDEVRRNGYTAFSINGTPADAVKIGVTQLYKERPDYIVAGINSGENAGVSCYYSGTVAAAREGCFWCVPSLAVSVSRTDDESYAFAAQKVRELLKKIMDKEIVFDPARVYLNINFPDLPPEEIRGIRVTRQGLSPFKDDYRKSRDSSGNQAYWIYGEKEESKDNEDDDVQIKTGIITVTPLTLDSTDSEFFNRYRERELLKW
jgi:5'-nucleotidase